MSRLEWETGMRSMLGEMVSRKEAEDRIAELEARIAKPESREVTDEQMPPGVYACVNCGSTLVCKNRFGEMKPEPAAVTDEQIERGVDVLRRWNFKWPTSSMRFLSKAIICAALQEGE